MGKSPTKIDSLDSTHISRGGVNETLQSQLYQVNLLVLFAVKPKDKLKFQLSTEVKEAGKFDDVVIKTDKGFRLLQAKMKLNKSNLSLCKLFSGDDFNLIKYFNSFKQDLLQFFVIEDAIICTNNGFPNMGKDFIELTSKTEINRNPIRNRINIVETIFTYTAVQ